MNSQHLSDEAVAAFADGVLGGFARERARRHTAECAECAYAVTVQREAAWALRAAPAPALPTSLVDRLRTVPQTTPITTLPTAIDPDGTPMLSTFAPMAALVPSTRSSRRGPIVLTAAALALAGALTAGAVADQVGSDDTPGRGTTVRHATPGHGGQPDQIAPLGAFRVIGH